jgi:pilus assembly protein CpaE
MGFLAVATDRETNAVYRQLASEMDFVEPVVIDGTCLDAANFLAKNQKFVPNYIVIDIGSRGIETIPEIDQLAEYCVENTKVVVVGSQNDLNLYRQLLQRGVAEYFIKPFNVRDLKEALLRNATEVTKSGGVSADGKIISFMSAASGDGATTVALNVAYQLAKEHKQKTLIVDMDYQFGMIARNLDLVANYGLKELYEHPEGAIDLTLIEKTVINYRDNLGIISSPKALRYFPVITANMIGNLLYTLRTKYKYIVLDLPHTWSDWVVSTLKEVDHNYLVSQLWIKSATHASRFLDAIQVNGIPATKTSLVVNRSGSKFKEAVSPADFATACKKKIAHYISNDSKTVITAENQGKTAVEIGNSAVNKQFLEIANAIMALKSLEEVE